MPADEASHDDTSTPAFDENDGWLADCATPDATDDGGAAADAVAAAERGDVIGVARPLLELVLAGGACAALQVLGAVLVILALLAAKHYYGAPAVSLVQARARAEQWIAGADAITVGIIALVAVLWLCVFAEQATRWSGLVVVGGTITCSACS